MHDTDSEFQRIYDAFHAKILRYLLRLIGEREAEDLTQEVFLKVSRALDSFRGESQLSTWIYRIATNTAVDRIRALSVRQSAEQAILEDSSEPESGDDCSVQVAPSLEHQLLRKERYECYVRFVLALPVNYRTVVVLSELEDMTPQEIAEILGLGLDVVKVRLHRGRERLLREFKIHCKPEDWL